VEQASDRSDRPQGAVSAQLAVADAILALASAVNGVREAIGNMAVQFAAR
jgi:hypothetical protein